MTRPREKRSMKDGTWIRQGRCSLPILFNLYSEYVTKETLEGFGDFRRESQIIRTAKCADELVLLAREETVLGGTTDRLFKIGIFGGKSRVIGISMEPSSLHVEIGQKQLENMEYFKNFSSMITRVMQDAYVKWNPGLPWQNQHLTRKRLFSPANRT